MPGCVSVGSTKESRKSQLTWSFPRVQAVRQRRGTVCLLLVQPDCATLRCQPSFWRYADLLDCATFTVEGQYSASMVVPPGAQIPGWALLKLDLGGSFDVDHARVLVNSQSTPTPSQAAPVSSSTRQTSVSDKASILTTPTATLSTSVSPTATSQSDDSKSLHTTNVSLLRPSAAEQTESSGNSTLSTITNTDVAPSTSSIVPVGTPVANPSSNSGTSNAPRSSNFDVPPPTGSPTGFSAASQSSSTAIRHWSRQHTTKAEAAALPRPTLSAHAASPEQMQEVLARPRKVVGLPF
ncbi:hypothetical protein FKP32DRAFT_1297319 [Trametes sanguinea]|nr:hypothetical protein FKP32DRAFT_1297319 [Trametes sanguinea]